MPKTNIEMNTDTKFNRSTDISRPISSQLLSTPLLTTGWDSESLCSQRAICDQFNALPLNGDHH